MLRVVSEFVPTPYYMLLCDDPRCAKYHCLNLPDTIGDGQFVDPEKDLVKAAMADGWLISLGRQLCPGHYTQLKEIMKRAAGKRVVEPEVDEIGRYASGTNGRLLI